MKKCTLTKIKIKQLLKNIDVEKSDTVNTQIFNDILKLHNIDFKEADKKKIRAKYIQSIKGIDKILYKEALANIIIDLTLEEPFKGFWVLRNGETDSVSIKRFMESQYNSSIMDN